MIHHPQRTNTTTTAKSRYPSRLFWSLLFWSATAMLLSMESVSGFQPISVLSPTLSRNRNTLVIRPTPSTTTTTTTTTTITTSSLFAEGGPAVLDRPTTIERVVVKDDESTTTKSDEKIGGEKWEIRLFNDPFNKREFVARCLSTVCGKSDTESFQIMMEAHNNGMGIIGRYPFERAELYYHTLREQGLMVEMVPVEDE